jgi:hypothetical protein
MDINIFQWLVFGMLKWLVAQRVTQRSEGEPQEACIM